MEKSRKLSTLSTISVFLLLEILAFVSFGLSNSFIVYSILGIVIAALLIVSYLREIKVYGFSSMFIFLMPILLFGIVNALGPFGESVGLSLALRIFIPFGFLAFASVGYVVGTNKEVDITLVMLVIYGGIALVVLISYIMTMVQYVPFYTIIHKNHYIYYNGAKADNAIGETSYFLMGFKFHEVSINYFSLFPSVLASSVVALFFISPKKEKWKFIVYAVYAFIGIFVLITMPSRMTLITDILIIIALAVLVLKAKNLINSKVLKWIFIIFIILFALGFFILILNAQSSWGATAWLRNLIAGNPLLNKLFNTNGLVQRYNTILDGALSLSYWVGMPIDLTYSSTSRLSFLSKSIIFDSFVTSGLLGLLIFVVILVIAGRNYVKYFVKEDEPLTEKVLIGAFLLSFYLYSFINYDMQPYLFYTNFLPFYVCGLFLITLFLTGYLYSKNLKPLKKKEVSENEKQN